MQSSNVSWIQLVLYQCMHRLLTSVCRFQIQNTVSTSPKAPKMLTSIQEEDSGEAGEEEAAIARAREREARREAKRIAKEKKKANKKEKKGRKRNRGSDESADEEQKEKLSKSSDFGTSKPTEKEMDDYYKNRDNSFNGTFV